MATPRRTLSRRRPTHGVLLIDGQPTVVFDTVCTKDREPWLATHKVHALLRKVWQAADAWLVGRYVIMPDHIHYFAAATETSIEFENWVRYWKSQFSKQHGAPDLRWQAGHWDTRMRSARAFEDKWNYVRENPVRKGLVRDVDEWPFQGEVFDWRWE